MPTTRKHTPSTYMSSNPKSVEDQYKPTYPVDRKYQPYEQTEENRFPEQELTNSLNERICNWLGRKDTVKSEIPLIESGLNRVLSGENKPIQPREHALRAQWLLEQWGRIEQARVNQPTTPSTKYLMPKRIIEKLNEVELTGERYPVFVIHPIEGHVSMLKNWAKHMEYPVFGIQYTQEALKFDSIEKLADFYLQEIENEFGVQTRFHLIGFSFGGSVAYEMSLKRSGRIASLTFLDGCHVYSNEILKSIKSKYGLNFGQLPVIQSEFLYGFLSQYTQMMSERKQYFIQQLVELPTYESRVQYTIKYLLKVQTPTFNFDLFDVEQAAKSYVQRMFMSYKYQPKSLLKLNINEILLVKPTVGDSEFPFGDDNGLGEWFQGRVKVQMIDCDKRSFLESVYGPKIARIVNDYLTKYYH
jgi:fatty acid synthase